MIRHLRLVSALALALCVLYACKTVPLTPAPKNSDFMKRVAAKLEANDIDGALALFGTLSPADAALAQNKIAKASIYLSAGRSQLARTEVNEVIAEDAANIEARYVLSAVEASEKKLRQQRTLLEDIVKDSPNFVPALNDLGRIAIDTQKNLKKATGYYETALKAEPTNEDSLIGRARVYRLEKKPNEALDMLNKAVASHPQSAYAVSERGRLYRSQGALDEALVDMTAAVKLAPNDYWCSYDRGLTLIDKNNKKEALEEFKRATRIEPNMFISYVYAAGISDELGMDAEAEKSYKKITLLKPDYYFGFEGLGVHALKKGNYMLAANNFLQAFNYAQEETNYALLTAYCWLKADNTKERKDAVRKVIGEAMRHVKRESLDYYVLRLFAEGTGDSDVARRAEKENDSISKVRAFFYLGCYYDLKNLPSLSEKYSDSFSAFNRRDIVEYRINDILHPDTNIVVKENMPSYP